MPGRPLGFFLAVLLLFGVLGSLAQARAPLAGLAWTQLFCFLLPALAAAASDGLRPGPFLLLSRRPRPGQMALGLLAGLCTFAAAAPLVSLWSMVLPGWLVQIFDLSPLFGGPPERLAALVGVTTLVAPLCEEVAFRGYLLSSLRLRLGDGAALATVTVLFAALHLDPVRLPALLLQGAVFGWLALRSGSLGPALAAHAMNNGLASALALLDLDIPSAGAPAPRTIGALLACGALALAAVLAAWRRAAPAGDAPPAAQAVAAADSAHPPGSRRPTLPAWGMAAALTGLALLGALDLLASR